MTADITVLIFNVHISAIYPSYPQIISAIFILILHIRTSAFYRRPLRIDQLHAVGVNCWKIVSGTSYVLETELIAISFHYHIIVICL